MDNQNESFDHGQFLGQESVEKDSKGGDCDDQHGTVPAFKDVSRVVQNDQALYDCPRQECYGHDCALPSCETQPACVDSLSMPRVDMYKVSLTCDEAQEFLAVPRGKFGHPMILTS